MTLLQCICFADAFIQSFFFQTPSAECAGLSNSKRKKLELAELKATSVEKLIKKVTVDRNKDSKDWADEYEAR